MDKESDNVLGELMNAPNCGDCIYSSETPSVGPDGKVLIGESQLICARFPPQCVMVSVQSHAGMVQGLRTQFPPVNKNMACYEFTSEADAKEEPYNPMN